MSTSAAAPPFSENLTDASARARASLLFAVRLWASVCLALYVAFWLELDNPSWAGTTAAIVTQTRLGASLRKGWFRIIGTVVGATIIVVLTALFPQNRLAFLGLLALWGGLCALGATVLHNFASYAAALAGATAAIIAADMLGATGGPSPEVFILAVSRASEICIGIVCAGVVLAGTDFGGAPRQLAAQFAALGADIASGFASSLALAGSDIEQLARRELIRRVIALGPVIDESIGESSRLRYFSWTLQVASDGLFAALAAWRGVVARLARLPNDAARQQVNLVLSRIPSQLRSEPAIWVNDPCGTARLCDAAVRRLVEMPASTPSLRLLADQTAELLAGFVAVLNGLALLVDDPARPRVWHSRAPLYVPDWLPALVSGARAFVAIGVVEIFWVVTGWPNGAVAIVFVAAVVALLSPSGELAYGASIAFGFGAGAAVLCAAVIKFAVLPSLATFPAFCVAIGLVLLPAGFGLAHSRQSAATALFTVTVLFFTFLLSPTNPMTYDTAQFYNSALALVVGSVAPPLAFSLLPPLSAALRARRLLALTLRDLRRLATKAGRLLPDDWEGRMYSRLAALPAQAEPLQRARLVTALSVGSETIQLRRIVPKLGCQAELASALEPLARGDSVVAIAQFTQLDRCLASLAASDAHGSVLRARARILLICDALNQHRDYFDTRATA